MDIELLSYLYYKYSDSVSETIIVCFCLQCSTGRNVKFKELIRNWFVNIRKRGGRPRKTTREDKSVTQTKAKVIIQQQYFMWNIVLNYV
jgi:hypothetical protein